MWPFSSTIADEVDAFQTRLLAPLLETEDVLQMEDEVSGVSGGSGVSGVSERYEGES